MSIRPIQAFQIKRIKNVAELYAYEEVVYWSEKYLQPVKYQSSDSSQATERFGATHDLSVSEYFLSGHMFKSQIGLENHFIL